MKITKLQTWLVRPRWAFIEISTDAGISGWGEPVLEGRAATVCECIHEMEPYLIGADPMKIEDLWTVLFRGGFYRGGGILMSAISGIDQALWDIKGKYFNVPVWQLMGGSCRDKMRVYSWVGGDRPADVGRAALEKKQQGFTAIKMNGTDELQFLDSYAKIDALLERVASVRESCGKDFGIAIDFHGRVHKPMAKIVAKKLEEFDPMFIEEPVLCDNMEYFPEIAAACNIPIATGERLFTKYDFKRLLAIGGVDIVQPDLSHAGGRCDRRGNVRKRGKCQRNRTAGQCCNDRRSGNFGCCTGLSGASARNRALSEISAAQWGGNSPKQDPAGGTALEECRRACTGCKCNV